MNKQKINIDVICPICSSENTLISNNHLYSNLKCKECEHVSLIAKEENVPKFIDKILKRNKIEQHFGETLQNVIEYSYCPYWTLMKYGEKTNYIIIDKNLINISFHKFSSQSARIFAKNILIPNKFTETQEKFIIELQKSSSL